MNSDKSRWARTKPRAITVDGDRVVYRQSGKTLGQLAGAVLYGNDDRELGCIVGLSPGASRWQDSHCGPKPWLNLHVLSTQPTDPLLLQADRVYGPWKRMTARRLLLGLLALAGGVAGLAVAEVTVRLLAPHARDHVLPAGFFSMDVALGWRLRPNMTVTHKTRYFAVTYTTNAFGYRDRARVVNMGAPVARALLYGDSQVFGWGVGEGQRFSDLLEERHTGQEVWNLGVPAYGLDQQVLAYEREGNDWRADTVILFFSRATLRRMRTGYRYRKYKPQFVLDAGGALLLKPVPEQSTAWTDPLYRFLSPLYLPYFVDRQLATIGAILHPSSESANARRGSMDESLAQLLRAVLDRAAGVARTRGQKLILLSVSAPDQALRSFCAEHEIEVITLSFAQPTETLVFGGEDQHWNALAQVAIADQVGAQWPGGYGGARVQGPTSEDP